LAAGAALNLFDAAIHGGGNPVYLLGRETAQAPAFDLQWPAFDGVDPDAAAVHRRESGLEMPHTERDAGESDDAQDDPEDPFYFAPLREFFAAWDVHKSYTLYGM